MPATKLAVAAWATSAAAVLSAATAGVYALASTRTSTSTGAISGSAAAAAVKPPTPSPSPNGNSQGNNGSGNGNGGNTGTQANSHPIVLTGQVVGQPAPGKTATLKVTVDNSKNQAIVIRSLIATVTSVTTGKIADQLPCDKAWYTIAPLSGIYPIAAGEAPVIPLTITFTDSPNVNQDNCKGATFNFSYIASADQA